MSDNLSSYIPVLDPGDIARQIFNERTRPFLTALMKAKRIHRWKGSSLINRAEIPGPGATNVNATYSKAEANNDVPPIAKMTFTELAKFFAPYVIDEEEFDKMITGSPELANVQQVEDALRAYESIANQLEIGMMRGTTRSLGTLTATPTGATVAVSASVIPGITAGTKVVAAASATASLRGAAYTIEKVNKSGLTVTLSASPVADTWTSGDLLFIEGNYVSASDRLGIMGLEAWNPLVAPTSSDSYGGYNRSAHEGLGGWRTTGSAANISGALDAAAQLVFDGAGLVPTHCFMHTSNYNQFKTEGNAKLDYTTDAQGNAHFGFKEATVETTAGPVIVKVTPYLPPNEIRVIDITAWELRHAFNELIGQPVYVPGASYKDGTNNIVFRYRSSAQLLNRRPSSSAVAVVS